MLVMISTTARWLGSLLVVFALLRPALAEVPSNAARRAKVIETPKSLEIYPASVVLVGPRSSQQLLVTGHYADGSARDLTHFCEWKFQSGDLCQMALPGLLKGKRDGDQTLTVSAAGISKEISVKVRNTGDKRPISFRREFMPVLSTSGCADIRCHGAPSGKDGFRLSLWGSDPSVDYWQLKHDMLARRTNSLNPDRSLIVNKALGRVPHVGGRRFRPDSEAANLIRQWQAEGLRDDAKPVVLKELTITPNVRVLHAPAQWQQLSVVATFDDGTQVDVTHLTTFSSSDIAVADVDRRGLVDFYAQGEVAILCRFMGRLESVRLAFINAPSDDFKWPDPPENNYVDKHVFAKLKLLNLLPSELCTDEQFVRRVYVDLCGKLPTPDETNAFLVDSTTDKRTRLIDELLGRKDFAVYWTKKWLDVLRVSRDSIQWAGSKTLQSWLVEQIGNDQSFADVVHQMLVSQGESFKDAPVNFYCVSQIPMGNTDSRYLQKDLAEATAQLFMGVRLQCAKCHNHPYERWTQNDYLGVAAHFTQVKRERLGKAGPKGRAERRQFKISLDPKGAEVTNENNGQTVAPRLPGQAAVNLDAKEDRRKRLADWFKQEDNPYFAKAIVNRIWYHLNGRGIVEPVDDFRDSNPSANDALLQALAENFIESGFRLKPLIRSITNSRTYQLSPIPHRNNYADRQYFSHMKVRPLPAEVLFDSIGDITGIREEFKITSDYTIGVPEGFVELPKATRAVELPVNDIVTLINSSSKYVRYESHPFLRAFGQPTRTQTCECDREQQFGRKQALEMIIGKMLSARLARKDNLLGKLLGEKKSDQAILDALFIRALCRRPSAKTANRMLAHVEQSSDKREAWEDVLWMIVNSQEFVYQH